MTVKNYVLDINKTSLQHPSIVLRQDDYNIYTINISVTENGTPVDLGSYTLNFLGITPAGAKIIDSKNFITNAGDLKSGKFSYKFPKEAAGSKGVYDVAYFRLKTTSGATSTIDLNLRVLGGIDLTADEVKDYITVDDTLRNTLVSEVFKKVDAKVDEHLATVKKGDKGDTGTYQVNKLVNTEFSPDLQGWSTSGSATYTTGNYDYNGAVLEMENTGRGVANLYSSPVSLNGSTNATISWRLNYYVFSIGANGSSFVYIQYLDSSLNPLPDIYIYAQNFADKVNKGWGNYTVENYTLKDIPIKAKYIRLVVDVRERGSKIGINRPMLVFGNSIGPYIPGNYNNNTRVASLESIIQDHAVMDTGNKVIAGDKTFTGNTNLATTTILAGNYGLRVTPSGFQKTTDGKTWVSANI